MKYTHTLTYTQTYMCIDEGLGLAEAKKKKSQKKNSFTAKLHVVILST